MESNEQLSKLYELQRQAYLQAPYPSYDDRIAALDKLKAILKEHKHGIAKAIAEDFGHRAHPETLVLEVFPSLQCIDYYKKNLKKWMKPQRRSVSIWFQPAKARVFYQPLGVVGIIVPWNYPLYLMTAPLIAALAAGNRAMIKLSEFTPKFNQFMKSLLENHFSTEQIGIITGGPEIGTAFSQLPFDHLLFTGSTQVGKHIMHAASEHLTPVTLELGGKSPTIIDKDVDISTATAKVMMSKLLNAGQTCIAPDYLYIHQSLESEFLAEAKKFVDKHFPDFEHSRDYTHIINTKQHRRLREVLQDAISKGATPHALTKDMSESEQPKQMTPTLFTGVTEDMRILQEEIFGPLLPIKTFTELDEVIAYIKQRPRPLALYYFGHEQSNIQKVLTETISGGVTINDCLLHVAQDDLPFGGVGPSGMGHYHGKEGFETFSKKKPIFYQSKFAATSLLYPPYKGITQKLLSWMVR